MLSLARSLSHPFARLLLLLGAAGAGPSLGCAHAGPGGAEGRWRPPHEADLPVGFPAPSEPGRVLLKWYPATRGALVRVEGALRSASFRGFWPLFRHIQREGIEMTAPVVSDYESDVRTSERGAMDMAFLYPEPGLGTSGPVADTGVRVVDTPGLCVVSVGVEGSYDLASLRAAIACLDAWLAENGGTWRAAGAPRRLSYQQPLPFKRLYSEVQVPVAPAPLTP